MKKKGRQSVAKKMILKTKSLTNVDSRIVKRCQPDEDYFGFLLLCATISSGKTLDVESPASIYISTDMCNTRISCCVWSCTLHLWKWQHEDWMNKLWLCASACTLDAIGDMTKSRYPSCDLFVKNPILQLVVVPSLLKDYAPRWKSMSGKLIIFILFPSILLYWRRILCCSNPNLYLFSVLPRKGARTMKYICKGHSSMSGETITSQQWQMRTYNREAIITMQQFWWQDQNR